MITSSFDNKSKDMTDLKSFYGERKHLVDICLVILSKKVYEYILENYDCKEIANMSICNGDITIYKFNFANKDVAFYLSGLGSAIASMNVIESNYLIGASKYIMFGSAGSLDDSKTKGRYVIPTESYRDEGMSYHYMAPSDYIEIKNHNFIKEVFDKLKVPYIQGRVWTTDAFLRETKDQVSKRKKEGVIAVDMELAGVQSVCNYHNIELYNFLVPGDVLDDVNYDIEGLNNANHSLDKFFLALEIVKYLK